AVLGDRLRDTTVARERLAQLVELMAAPILLSPGNRETTGESDKDEMSDEAMQSTLHMSNTVRVVLPNGDDHLDRSARDMLDALSPEHYLRLQQVLQRLVLEHRAGLTAATSTAHDPPRSLAVLTHDQATAFLTTL